MRKILFIALLVRLIVTFLIYIIARDGTRFIAMAQNLYAGDINAVLSEQYHPLYCVLIFLWHFLIPNWEYSARIAAVVMGVLTLIPLFYLTKDLFDETVAKTAVLLYAFHPYAVRYCADVLSGSTYIFFIMISLWLGYLSLTEKKNIRLIFLSGGSAALAYLTRPEGIGVFLVLALFCAARIFFGIKKKKRFLSGLTALILLISGFMLFSSPYLIAIKHKTGYWQITTKKRNRDFLPYFIRKKLFADNQPLIIKTEPAVEISSNNKSVPHTADISKKRPVFQAFSKKNKACISLTNTFFKIYHPLLFIFMIIGLLYGLKDKSREQKLMLYIIFSVVFLYLYVLYKLSLGYYISKRHMLPIVTILFCFAAKGIDVAGNFKQVKQILKFRKFTAGFILTFICVCVFAPKTFKPLRFKKKYIKDIAGWIMVNGDTNSLYAVDDPRITFYAGVKSVTVPKCDLPLSQITYFLQSRNPKYLLLDKSFISKYIKELPQLVGQGHLMLTSIYKHTDKKTGKREYLFYEYFKEL